jgi:outer membrane protein assembly factor BamB
MQAKIRRKTNLISDIITKVQIYLGMSSVFSSPAIGSDGTVYVGSFDNKLYAIPTDSKGLAKSPWPMRGQNPLHTGRTK